MPDAAHTSASTRASCSASRPASAAISASSCARWAARRDAAIAARWSSTRPRRCPPAHGARLGGRPSSVVAGSGARHVVGADAPAARVRTDPARRVLRAGPTRRRCGWACRSSWRSTTCRSSRTRSGSAAREGLRRRWLTRQRPRARARRSSPTRSSRAGEILSGGSASPRSHPRRSRPARHATRGRHAAGDDRRWCCSSARLFNRRRLPELIAAFAARRRDACPDARLVIVGDNRTLPAHRPRGASPRPRPSASRVEWRAVRRATPSSSALYAPRACFAFLSDYEGFGHDAARGARARRAARCCSTRRSRARSTATRRASCAARRRRSRGATSAIRSLLEEPSQRGARCWPRRAGRAGSLLLGHGGGGHARGRSKRSVRR